MVNKDVVGHNINRYNRLYSLEINPRYIFNFEYRQKKFRDLIKSQKIKTTSQDVLDLGFGFGYFLMNFDKSCQIYGVDVSKQAIGRGQRGFKDKKYCKVDFMEHNLEYELPYRDGQFDFVICSHIIEHVSSPEFLLKEINRVLKREGLLFILAPINQKEIPSFEYSKFSKKRLKRLMQHFSIVYEEENAQSLDLFEWVNDMRLKNSILYPIALVENIFFSLLPLPIICAMERVQGLFGSKPQQYEALLRKDSCNCLGTIK